MPAEFFADQCGKGVADSPGIEAGEGKILVLKKAPANGSNNGEHGKHQQKTVFQLALFSLRSKSGVTLEAFKKGQDRPDQKLINP